MRFYLTYPTSIDGYAATFPKGESKKVRFRKVINYKKSYFRYLFDIFIKKRQPLSKLNKPAFHKGESKKS